MSAALPRQDRDGMLKRQTKGVEQASARELNAAAYTCVLNIKHIDFAVVVIIMPHGKCCRQKQESL